MFVLGLGVGGNGVDAGKGKLDEPLMQPSQYQGFLFQFAVVFFLSVHFL